MDALQRFSLGFSRFFKTEAASGILLALAALVSLILANSSFAESFRAVWETHLTIGLGSFVLDYPLWYWINDALMAIFFFVVGLEIKRELVHGELNEPRKVVLPLVAAVGGAMIPALIYLGLNPMGEAGRSGWAVPMATDIAFVVGVLALMGKRIPSGLRVFLLSLAIADDLIAVLIIALFYTGDLNLLALGLSIGGLILVAVMNRLGVRSIGVYILAGSLVWLAFLKSGVHPTVAGVALGLLTPAKSLYGPHTLQGTLHQFLERLKRTDSTATGVDKREAEEILRESSSPLHRIEHALHPFVAFGIMPLFALVNAGVPLSPESMGHSVAVAVALGLVLGKPAGIALFAFVAVKLGLAALPNRVRWLHVLGGGALSGIGFTMALFIANLGLQDSLLEAAKAGIVLASAISASVGVALLLVATRKEAA